MAITMELTNKEKVNTPQTKEIVYKTKGLNLWYGNTHALKNIDLDIHANEVTAIIGPSGCGKSTYIKTLNRMVEMTPIVRTSGEIEYRGKNIFDKSYHVEELRTQVGMVFQKPNPFPKSIYDNIAYGPRIHGVRNKKKLDEIVEKVILMDEPTSALDPISTLKVEELVQELKKDFSIIIVTHNMQQAARISDKTAFFLNGEVVEYAETDKIFSMPSDKRTEDYITGRFG
ncbi:phosphate ABC transporter ATP-binding protein [Priestia megaterium]|uniref:phosphate ABC transporter ATP-binding protein n=1 Tax=Priestia megaterium TaxID=1404 RepID=UPI003393DBE9